MITDLLGQHDLLRQAVGLGLAERPFKSSERYRLSA